MVTDKQIKHYNICNKLIDDCSICKKIFDKLQYNYETKMFYRKEDLD